MTNQPFGGGGQDKKLDPSSMELHTNPRPLVQLKKHWLIAVVAIGVLLLTFMFYSAAKKRSEIKKKQEPQRMSATAPAKADIVSALPRDYKEAKKYSENNTDYNQMNTPLIFMDKTKAQLIEFCEILLKSNSANLDQKNYCNTMVLTNVPAPQENIYTQNDAPNISPQPHTGSKRGRGEKPLQEIDEEEKQARESGMSVELDGGDHKRSDMARNTPQDVLSELLQPKGAQQPRDRIGSDDNIGQGSDTPLNRQQINPSSPYIITAGTIIPISLIRGINSDLPGETLGTVRANIYDSNKGKYLLVPQGSRVIGKYDSMVVYGQNRVLVVWSRIIRPDGVSISLDAMPGIDMSGYSGMSARANNHFGKILTSVVLSSVLSATTATSKGDRYAGSLSQDFARNLGGGVNDAGQEILDRDLRLKPTLEVKPGALANIFVTKDFELTPYE